METEATIKIWVDGERYVRTAEGNGPVNALDKALRERDRRALPAPPRHPARELQGAHPGRAQGHRRGHARAARRRPTARTPGARSACPRTSSRRAGRRSWTRSRRACCPRRNRRAPRAARRRVQRADPARAAAGRRARGGAGARDAALRALVAGPAPPRVRGAPSPRGWAPTHVSAVSSGTAGLHLAIRAAGVEPGDEVVTTPVQLRGVGQLPALRERPARCSATSTRARSTSIPDAAAAAVAERTTGLLPVHIFGYPADMPALERLAAERALWIVEDACEALGAAHADGAHGGRARQPGRLRLLPEQADHHGGGRRGGLAVGRRPRSASTPSATRAARRTWAGSTTTGSASTTASTTSPARSGSRSSSASTRCSRRAPAWPLSTARRWPEWRASTLPCPDAGGDRRSWFVYVVQLPPGVDRDAAVMAMRERGVDTKPYLPAIHLLSFYRERFGHREGEFPVCEDVAAPLARAAVLPAAHRRRGGAGGRGAQSRHRPTDLTSATNPGSRRAGAR